MIAAKNRAAAKAANDRLGATQACQAAQRESFARGK